MKKIKIHDAHFVAFVLLTIAMIGLFDAVKDTLAHHYSESVFTNMNRQFWDASVSWCNKWKNCKSGKERFPLSSSALVFLTDGWHLMKFMITRLNLIFPALLLGISIDLKIEKWDKWYIKCLIFYFLLGFFQAVVFHLFYHYILIR